MGTPIPDSKERAAHGTAMRGHSRDPRTGLPTVADQLPDSFPLLPGESQWLSALMADQLARILAND